MYVYIHMDLAICGTLHSVDVFYERPLTLLDAKLDLALVIYYI